MAKRRRFTPEFKAELVLRRHSSGESSQAEVCRHHNLNENQLSTVEATTCLKMLKPPCLSRHG